MEQSKRDVSLGRFLSLVLRHQPSAAHITLDAHGWADVDALLAGCAQAGRSLTREDLERIVRENDKTRYSFNDDHTKIRANQGHSVPVDVELRQLPPPDTLYHGTARRFLDSIRSQGLRPMGRQYVHLSKDTATALTVGRRHGPPVVLAVDAAAMAAEGYVFYLSENGVWQCEAVPWRFLRVIQETF